MMYSSLFEELESILSGCIHDTTRRQQLEYFFTGPARWSVDWIFGEYKRTAAHVFTHYLTPESVLWTEECLEKIFPLLPGVLLAQLCQQDAWNKSPLQIAYAKKPNHPLILKAIRDLLEPADFNPEAAEELILNHAKRLILIQTLRADPALSREQQRLQFFCEKISLLHSSAESTPFFQEAYSSCSKEGSAQEITHLQLAVDSSP